MDIKNHEVLDHKKQNRDRQGADRLVYPFYDKPQSHGEHGAAGSLRNDYHCATADARPQVSQ